LAVFTLIYFHAEVASMGPHILSCSCHTIISLTKGFIKAMTLKPMMGNGKYFLMLLLVLQYSMQEKCVEDKFVIKLVAEARGISHLGDT
jgi:hypothetical protein